MVLGASRPDSSLAVGAILRAGVLSLSSTPIRFGFPVPPPGQPRSCRFHEGKRGGDGREERQGGRRRGAWARRRRRGGGRGAHAGRGVRGRDRRGEGVRDGVHPGAGEPPGPPAAEGVAGRGHLRAGDRADGPPARRGHPAARTGIHVRLLAHLALPGRGGRAGGVAGQRPRRQAPAGAGQERHGRLRVALQAERAGHAAAVVRAPAGGPGPAGADPEPGPGWPRTRPGTRPGWRRSSKTRC